MCIQKRRSWTPFSLNSSIISKGIFVVYGIIFYNLDESALLEERERSSLKIKTSSASSVKWTSEVFGSIETCCAPAETRKNSCARALMILA